MRYWWIIPLALGILLGFLFNAPAHSHSWYDVSCCAGDDCEPIPAEALIDRGDNYEIDYASPRFGEIHESFPRSSVKQSKDGQFHICIQKPQPLTGRRVRCIYEPVSG